jgi:hypothetical protein
MNNIKGETIISTTDSGMGNRLKSLLSIMRMTNNYMVYWPKSRFGCAKFSDLFVNDFEVVKFPFFSNIFIASTKLIYKPKIRFSPYFKVLDYDEIDYGFAPGLYDQKKGKISEINNGKSIDFQYHRIPKKIQDNYIEQVKKLVPIKYIQDEVAKFYKKSFNENTISVQIRTWKDETRRQGMFSKDEYFKYLDKLPNNKFFISSDDQGIVDEIMNRYPGRAFFYPKRISNYEPGSQDSKSIEFQQDSLIDMLLLGKTSLIIGSHLSSFVECAWWLGLCKPRVVILNQNNDLNFI